MVKKQAKLVWRDAAPPGGTVLPLPLWGTPPGTDRTVPPGGRFSTVPRSSRGVTREGGHLLPRRHPPQTLSGSIVEIILGTKKQSFIIQFVKRERMR